jgi:hypothetical protein
MINNIDHTTFVNGNRPAWETRDLSIRGGISPGTLNPEP